MSRVRIKYYQKVFFFLEIYFLRDSFIKKDFFKNILFILIFFSLITSINIFAEDGIINRSSERSTNSPLNLQPYNSKYDGSQNNSDLIDSTIRYTSSKKKKDNRKTNKKVRRPSRGKSFSSIAGSIKKTGKPKNKKSKKIGFSSMAKRLKKSEEPRKKIKWNR